MRESEAGSMKASKRAALRRAKKKNSLNRSVFQSMTLIVQFGINMLVPIGMLSALGIFLDRKLGTSYIVVILFFVGAIAGGQNVYRMAKQIYKRPQEKEEREQQ